MPLSPKPFWRAAVAVRQVFCQGKMRQVLQPRTAEYQPGCQRVAHSQPLQLLTWSALSHCSRGVWAETFDWISFWEADEFLSVSQVAFCTNTMWNKQNPHQNTAVLHLNLQTNVCFLTINKKMVRRHSVGEGWWLRGKELLIRQLQQTALGSADTCISKELRGGPTEWR